jgi:hypothetical protein
MVRYDGLWTGFLLYTKRAPSMGAITRATIEAAHPDSAGRAVMMIWNVGQQECVLLVPHRQRRASIV